MRMHPRLACFVSCFLTAVAGVMLLASPPAAAQPKPQELTVDGRAIGIPAAELYRAQTIVTGQGEANRIIGFASCLQDVLIKVSGMLRLAGDPRLDAYKANAARLVRDFSYRDEKGGKPKNDEQGTRDRSFFLTADFDEADINGILAGLGVKPWLTRRPVLAVFVEMQQGARRYLVAATRKRRICSGLPCWRPRPNGECKSCCPMPPRWPASAPMIWRLLASRPRSSLKPRPGGAEKLS